MIDLRAEASNLTARYPQGRSRSALIPLLKLAQERDGWVTAEAIREVASILGLKPAEVRAVASFYSMLHLEPKGKHVISVCHNLACTLMGAERVIDALEQRLGTTSGTTTEDGEFTLERAECLAFCDRAPMAQIDYDEMVGPLDPGQVLRLLERARSRSLTRPESSSVVPDPSLEKQPATLTTETSPAPIESYQEEDEAPPLIDTIELSDAERHLLHTDEDGDDA